MQRRHVSRHGACVRPGTHRHTHPPAPPAIRRSYTAAITLTHARPTPPHTHTRFAFPFLVTAHPPPPPQTHTPSHLDGAGTEGHVHQLGVADDGDAAARHRVHHELAVHGRVAAGGGEDRVGWGGDRVRCERVGEGVRCGWSGCADAAVRFYRQANTAIGLPGVLGAYLGSSRNYPRPFPPSGLSCRGIGILLPSLLRPPLTQ